MSWTEATLKEIAPAKALKHPEIKNEQLVWQLTLDQIESGSGLLLTKERKPLVEAGNSTYWFNEKNVLYSKLRPYLNKVIIPDEEGLGTTELVPLLPDEIRLDRKYLAYYLRSNAFVNWISSQTAGAKMPRVSMKVFWEHKIPLPPLPEQKRIAAILDKADAICRKRQQAIDLADEFLRSVFLDMFGDPVTNPKRWNEYEIKKGISSISSGWSVSGDNKPAEATELGVLKISAVTTGTFKPDENKAVDSSVIPSNKVLLQPKKGDLIFSRANTRELVAATALVCEDYSNLFLPDKLWKIKTNEKYLLPEFLHFLLQHPRMKYRLTSQATGTSGSMLNISKKKFETTLAPFPSIKLQQSFVKRVLTVTNLKDRLALSADDLSNQFNSLSQQAFAGKL